MEKKSKIEKNVEEIRGILEFGSEYHDIKSVLSHGTTWKELCALMDLVDFIKSDKGLEKLLKDFES